MSMSMMTQIEIRTEDGTCPAYVFRPQGAAASLPGVLLYMDGIGMRPALHQIAERLARAGYHVLLPDLFYRIGPYEAPEAAKLFADEATRGAWFKRIGTVATIENIMRDTRAFLAHFDQKKIGITGYCMGGRLALAAAGHFPERVAAAAAYHPGNPANDAPDSPHRLASKMKAEIYVGAAANDPSCPEEQKARLAQALTDAGVVHTIETYQARHGWVPTDTPAHDPAAAEKHFQTLLALLARTLA
jgi:carboxymethylenebutenolidase